MGDLSVERWKTTWVGDEQEVMVFTGAVRVNTFKAEC